MRNIAVVGSSNTDMIIQVPHLPAPGETVLGGHFSMSAGGKGANQAVAAARAGGHVTFLACVGDDEFGKRAVAGYVEEGIETDCIVVAPDDPSGVALIWVDKSGENSIAVAASANERLLPEHVRERERIIEGADVLLLQLEIPLETVAEAVEIAGAYGTRIILNPAPAQNLPSKLLTHVAVLTPNESEAAFLTGIDVGFDGGHDDAARILLQSGVGAVVITLGARGAYVATPDERFHVPGFPVEAVDTTGAGDVFNGALAVAIAEGASLRWAVRFANAAAAYSVTRLGAQPSIPRRADILRIMSGDNGTGTSELAPERSGAPVPFIEQPTDSD